MTRNKQENTSQAWGISALVTGILSLLLIFMPYFGLPLGIFAVVAYAFQRKNGVSGMATAGLVLGILGTIINGVTMLFLLMILALAGI